MKALVGNTYPFRQEIKSCGGKWDPHKQLWMVPTDSHKELQSRVLKASHGRKSKIRCTDCDDLSYVGTKCYQTGKTH